VGKDRDLTVKFSFEHSAFVGIHAFAGAATTASVLAMICVLFVEWMTTFTNDLSSVNSRWSYASENVFLECAESQVIDIHAQAVSAQMVNRQTFRNWTMCFLPEIAMDELKSIGGWNSVIMTVWKFLVQRVATRWEFHQSSGNVFVRFFAWSMPVPTTLAMRSNLFPTAFNYSSLFPALFAPNEPNSFSSISASDKTRAFDNISDDAFRLTHKSNRIGTT